jgi:hypothetical protein
MMMFETPAVAGLPKQILWLEPNYVVEVRPGSYTEGGAKVLTAVITTLTGTHVVLDPSGDAGKQIAAEKAKRAGELSIILSTLMRPNRRQSDVAAPTQKGS